MSKLGGYVLKLTEERERAFEERGDLSRFAEPVGEFSHSRNIPLVCLLVSPLGRITDIGFGKRGVAAGTGLRRLNVSDIHHLDAPIGLAEFYEKLPNLHRKRIEKRFSSGGKVSDKAFDVLIESLVMERPDLLPKLANFRTARRIRIQKISPKAKGVLAQEKEAVATALAMSGIDRSSLDGWDYPEGTTPISFLAGLPRVRLREDQMIVNDLHKFPGLEALRTHVSGSVEFSSESRHLTIILANRLPLEQLTGADLIYYNQGFRCFLMVQYKAMEADDDESEAVFRFPQIQLTEELSRMKELVELLETVPYVQSSDNFRINRNPFFLKFCPRLVFDPDSQSLSKGMYLPLDYWRDLSEHPSMDGPKGGKRVTYRNVRRYFDNSCFCAIAASGWIGTTSEQSNLLEKLVRETIESGRAVVLASFEDSDARHRTDG